jgi:surface carbohydrate biosynthesis protein
LNIAVNQERVPNARGWLIIPVEVQVRELLGRLLVGAIAAERGYKVLIGHDRVIRRLAAHLPRGILFDKSLGGPGDRRVSRYARLGYSITAIDEESTGFSANPELYLSTRLARDTLDVSARWFCISDRLRGEAQKLYPAYKDRFATTGLPRTDIWRKEFHALFESEKNNITESNGKFLLFCSNFGTIIHTRRGAFVENQYRKQQKAHTGAGQYQEKLREQGRQNLEAFIEVLPRIADWFPDHKVVIRPHPSEDRDFWREVALRHPHLEVQDRGLSTPWILASSCLIHHGCTTGIEAELLGNPHIMYAPFPDDHHDTDIMRAFAPIVHDEKSLRESLAEIVGGDRSRAKPRSTLETYYASLDGPLVASHIMDEIDRIDMPPPRPLPRYLGLLRYAPRHLVAQYLPRTARASTYDRQKWRGTTLGEIGSALQSIEKGAGLTRTVAAREIFPQLFMLEARA